MGRPRKHKARTLWDAIQYIAATGCQWAQLPKDFPPFTTVQYHFYRMRDNGLLDAVNGVGKDVKSAGTAVSKASCEDGKK